MRYDGMLMEWVLSKLEDLKEQKRLLVRDPLHLLPQTDHSIEEFAEKNGFIVIIAATNLVFRELYEHALDDTKKDKILLIDRTPEVRITSLGMRAPPLFYPDFRANEEAQIKVDLQQFLKEKTGDSNWPKEVNDPLYSPLIANNLEGVIRSHQNLRMADDKRFTDQDFKTIVAFAALGVEDAAFKKLDSKKYWRIGLLNHGKFKQLNSLAPEVMTTIKEQISKAPKPFCWFSDQDPEKVIRGFYLSLILAQHFKNWQILLANIDSETKPYSEVKKEVLLEAAPKLVELDPKQAEIDLRDFENSLTSESLKTILLDQMHIQEASGFSSAIKKEGYSTLIRSLALLMSLKDLLSNRSTLKDHENIYEILFNSTENDGQKFVDKRESIVWSNVKDAYQLAYEIQRIRIELSTIIKNINVLKDGDLSFGYFWKLWNEKKINRLDYFLSALERLLDYGELLPNKELPQEFVETFNTIKQLTQDINYQVRQQLNYLNSRFQDTVVLRYSSWVAKDSDVILTSQFIRRCLKPNWDPDNEKAVIFIFDGMRYDIWDELLHPLLSDSMDIIEEYPASSLLPSETQISRKAICAGNYPDEFDTRDMENKLLREALRREFHYTGEVEVINPEGLGTGETVRYRAKNLDVYIFQLCDEALHGISIKDVKGRDVPALPMVHIYQKQLKDILEHEVMAIVRRLMPGTKVFVTADHGFGYVGRQKIWFKEENLNDPQDCYYMHCNLKVPLVFTDIPQKIKNNIIEFKPEDLKLPKSENVINIKSREKINKTYKSVVFPRIGYSFSRPGGRYDPDAYSHGGISIQEMMVPMVVLEVKTPEGGLIMIDQVIVPKDAVENEELLFSFRLRHTGKSKLGGEDIHVDVEASYSQQPEKSPLNSKIVFVPSWGSTDVTYRFKIDSEEATPEERRDGIMKRRFIITAKYRVGDKTIKKSQYYNFDIKLNPERIIRRVGNLGNILGLTPRNMR